MAGSVNFVMILLLCRFIIFLEAEAEAAAAEKSMYVFGDSLFDVGNLQYYTPATFVPANHPPYGSSFLSATGRRSDGLVVPDFIAEYGKMPLIPPALDPKANGTFGYNFACSGAGVLYHAGVMNLDEQLRLYKNLTALNMESKNMVSKSVHLFSIGGNDYFEFCTDNLNVTEQEMQDRVDLVIQGLKAVIQEIYLTGGRKFAFQDVGPLGCVPTFIYALGVSEGCYENLNTIARLHNVGLRNILKNMTDSEEYNDIKYGVFDYYNQLYLRINNFTNYGFIESEIACCGYGGKLNADNCGTSPYFLCSNPGAFVFFDGSHTSQALNLQLAELMWTGDQSVIAPYNVQQLFQIDQDDKYLHLPM